MNQCVDYNSSNAIRGRDSSNAGVGSISSNDGVDGDSSNAGVDGDSSNADVDGNCDFSFSSMSNLFKRISLSESLSIFSTLHIS